MISYAVTLSDALTPITLISGVGLLLLAMTARSTTPLTEYAPCLKSAAKKLRQLIRFLRRLSGSPMNAATC